MVSIEIPRHDVSSQLIISSLHEHRCPNSMGCFGGDVEDVEDGTWRTYTGRRGRDVKDVKDVEDVDVQCPVQCPEVQGGQLWRLLWSQSCDSRRGKLVAFSDFRWLQIQSLQCQRCMQLFSDAMRILGTWRAPASTCASMAWSVGVPTLACLR